MLFASYDQCVENECYEKKTLKHCDEDLVKQFNVYVLALQTYADLLSINNRIFSVHQETLRKNPARIGFLWFMVVIYFAPSFVRAFALLIWACSQRDCLYYVPVDYLVTCVIGALPTE